MTERTSQNKRIEEKVDILIAEMYSIKGDIKELQKQMEMQPKVDEQRFVSLEKSEVNCKVNFDTKIAETNKRIDKNEESMTWLIRTAIVEGVGIIGALVGVVFTFLNKQPLKNRWLFYLLKNVDLCLTFFFVRFIVCSTSERRNAND